MRIARFCFGVGLVGMMLAAGTAKAQKVGNDPAEPLANPPQPKLLARPTGTISRTEIDEKAMGALIHELVSCGTRLTLSSWTDPKRGAGCARDKIARRFNEISKATGEKLQVIVDKFEATAERTAGKAVLQTYPQLL